MVKPQATCDKSANHRESPSYQIICGNKANLNVCGDLGYDDDNSLNQMESATLAVMDQQFEILNNDDDMILQGTLEDSLGVTLMSTNGTPSVADLQPKMNLLNNDVNGNRVIPLNANANNNLLAYEDQTNQKMDNNKPMANQNQDENDENETNENNKNDNANI